MSLPVTRVLTPVENESVICRSAGNSRVLMLTSAPEKSPERSGVKVLLVEIPSSRPAGKRSSGTTFRSGSVLGIRAPLSDVVV